MASNKDTDWGSKGKPTDAARLLRQETADKSGVQRDTSNDRTHESYRPDQSKSGG